MTQERYQPVQTLTRLRLRRLVANQTDNEFPPTPPQVVATAQPAAEPTPEPDLGLRLRLLRTPISALGGFSGEQIAGFTKGAAQQLITGRAVEPRYYGEELPRRPAMGAEQFGASVASFIRPAPITSEELANPVTAAMLAVPPAGALGITAERAAAQALAGQTARRVAGRVLMALGKPEAAIRTEFTARPSLAGAQETSPGVAAPRTKAQIIQEIVALDQAEGNPTRDAANLRWLLGRKKQNLENFLASRQASAHLPRANEPLRGQGEMPLPTESARPLAEPGVQPPILEPTEPVAAQVGKAQAPMPTQQVVPPRPVGPSSAEVPSLVAKPPSPPAETPADVIDRLLKAHAIESVARSRPPSLPPLAEGREPPVPPVPPAAGGTQLPPSGDSWIPGVRSNDAIIGMAYRNDWTRKLADQAARVPGLGKVAQVIGLPERNVFKQAEVLRASIMADWDSNSTGVVARLRSLGDSTGLFSVDKDGRALIGGNRVALNDVLEHPGQFTLTEQQKQFIQRLHKINDDKLARLTEEGIDVPQLSFEEGGHYVGRRVLGRVDSQGNLEIAATGAGARRVGAKAAFEKPRVFEEGTEQAIAAGYRYMKPEDVMQANLQAAGRRIADQRFSEFILDQVPYRTGAAPSELTVARDAAQQKLRSAVKLRDLVNRSIRGETPPQATLQAIARSYPEEIEQLRSALGDASALKQIRPVAADSIRAAQAVYRDAASALSHAQRIARTTRLGEGTVQAPAFAGKMFDAKDADAISRAMGLPPLPLWASVAQGVAWVNAPFRMLVTTYDVGVSGIQLLMTMFKNPVVWGKATGRGLEALVSGQRYQQFLANHAETISRWSPHGAIFTPSEFTETIRPGGLVARVPFLRSTARPFARYFEGILNAAEIYGLEAKDALNVGALRVGRGAASAAPEEMADWAAHWNVMTGRFDSSRRGISQAQQYGESAVGFAPRFRRAAYTLMTDIARGGVRGEQSREALSKFLLGGTFGYIGLAYALGQEPVLDPGRRGEWMTFDIAGQRVGLGSAYVITLRLLGQVAQDIADGQPQKIAGDAGRYAKGLLAPVPGISVDVAFSPNFGRDGIQRALQLTQRVAANNLIPGWAGALLDSRATDWESRAVGAGAQSLSLRSFPAKKIPSPSVPQPVSSSGQLRLRRQTLEPARR